MGDVGRDFRLQGGVLVCSGLGWMKGIGVHIYGGYFFLKYITYVYTYICRCGIYNQNKILGLSQAELVNYVIPMRAGHVPGCVSRACIDKFMTLL